MKIEGLSLYLENLLPGVVILISLLILLSPPSSPIQNKFIVAELLKSEFILSTAFLSISYLLGLVSAVISRFFVDLVDELFLRPWLLRWFSHKTYDQLKASLVSLPDEGQNWRKAWNEAFRASLSYIALHGPKEVITEVWRRREQGRLIRNLILPLILGSIALTQWFQIENGWIVAAVVLSISLFAIGLYSYGAYTTFAEAILHLPETNNKKQDKVREAQTWNITRIFTFLGQQREEQKKGNDQMNARK